MSVANILPEFRKLEEEVEDLETKQIQTHFFKFEEPSPQVINIGYGTTTVTLPSTQLNLTLPAGMDWSTSVLEELTFTIQFSTTLPAAVTAKFAENFRWNSGGTPLTFQGNYPEVVAPPGSYLLQQSFKNQQVAKLSGGNLVYTTPYLQDNTTEGLYIDDLDIGFVNTTSNQYTRSVYWYVYGKVTDYKQDTGAFGRFFPTVTNTSS